MQERRPVLETLTDRAGAPAARREGRPVLVGAVAALVVATDQLAKTVALRNLSPYHPLHVLGPVFLLLSYNSGAAFSLGQGITPVVEVVVVILVLAILLFGRRATSVSATVATATGLLLGGATGNLTDRVLRHHGGAVVDFIDILRIGHHDLWPLFNVADTAIVVGAFTLVLAYSRHSPTTPRGQSSAPWLKTAGRQQPRTRDGGSEERG